MAVNVPLVWPLEIGKLAGTVTFALFTESGTVNPLAGAGPVKDAVHGVLAGVFSVDAVQLKDAKATAWDNEIAPETPLAGIARPAGVEATIAEIWSGIGFANGDAEI